MKQQKPFLAALAIFVICLIACDSNEIGDSKDVNQDKIYMDYEVYYNQSDEHVALSLQYRFAGSAGTTLVLNDDSKVELDGEKIKVDSSEGGGAFYNVQKKFSEFIGKHTLSFTDLNGKKFENSFDFSPFTLHGIPAEAGRSEDLVIYYNLREMNATDYIEINSKETDSSFSFQQKGPGNRIIIPAKELGRQKRNIMVLECTLYRDIPLLQTTSEGGSLRMVYRLKPIKIKLQR